MRNRHNNNANTSQNELNSLTQEVKELVKKRDFDEFAMTQIRATTQISSKLRRIKEDMEEMDSRQKAFLDSIKEILITSNNLSPSSFLSSSPPKILYTVFTKK
ncbi:7711_t:CDS:1 [Paraglomus brasilianum]|uniref:7711_t:CDS:1 n=1 Tax=Paraglomus brasilianum TaxID=144538 RepID=A0A9N9DK67_9GLOM|nr:7711_t:CDS:1 [Paraglomus brasilianum]